MWWILRDPGLRRDDGTWILRCVHNRSRRDDGDHQYVELALPAGRAADLEQGGDEWTAGLEPRGDVEADQRREVEVLGVHRVARWILDPELSSGHHAGVEVEGIGLIEGVRRPNEDRHARKFAHAVRRGPAVAQTEAYRPVCRPEAECPTVVEEIVELETRRPGRSSRREIPAERPAPISKFACSCPSPSC
jgi:hypothetical protein